MDIPPFELERWLDEYEPGADVMLAESGIRSLPADWFDLDVDELGYVIPTDGDPALRGRIAERYGRTAEEVVLTCGTQEADFLTFAALLDGDDHAVVVTPTYQSLRTVPETLGSVTTVAAEPPDWELSVDAVAAAVRPETRAVVLVNPANPTGRYYREGTMRALYEAAEDADAFLVVDEVYRMLAEDRAPRAASLGPRAISTAGVSKSYGLAGARVGWTVAVPEVADAVRRWKDYTTIAPPLVGQAIAEQATGAMEADLLAENRAHALANRDRVAAFIERHGLDWYEPTGVNGLPTVPDGFGGSTEFCRSLVEEESVVLAPGDLFGCPDRFRIGFGLPSGELEEGLERVERHVERAQ
jgi:aspartate/methionine/tyrosine aminotransferase